MVRGLAPAMAFLGVRGASTAGVVPPRDGRGIIERRETAARARRCVAMLCAALLPMSGCSFVIVRPSPSTDTDTGKPECRSFVFPVLDLVGAAGSAVAVAYGQAIGSALSECYKYPNEPSCHFSPVPWIPAAVWAVSSIYGFWAASHCKSQLAKEQEEHVPQPDDHASPWDAGWSQNRPVVGGLTSAPYAPQRDAGRDAAEHTIP